MKSRSWPSASAAACAIISLLASSATAQTPAIAVVDAADAPQWQTWTKEVGWRVIAGAAADNPDSRVLALAAAVRDAIREGADPARIYIAGRGQAAALVFYAISRTPDLWAAGIAIEGSPLPAVDSGRLFAANFRNAPVLWASSSEGDQAVAAKLREDGMNVEWRTASGLSPAAVFQWLGSRKRAPFPAEVDCETNSPQFASCYWIRMTKFDPAERNDVLASTRLARTQTASLDLGGFGFKPDEPGPGLLISYLPEKYNGPLKLGDRIVAIDGRPVETAKRYLEMMARYTESRPAVATVQRGKDRVRLESFVTVPKPDNVVTARVQGQFLAAERELQIVSRALKEMQVTIPEDWARESRLSWNGLALEKIDGPGCVLLTVEKELLRAGKCP
jgi:predicted esterase